MAKKGQDAEINGTKRRDLIEGGSRFAGIAAAFTISVLTIAGGFYLLLNDKDLAGWTAMVSGLAVLVGAFVVKSKAPNS